jgi:hypothetical protein
MDPYTEKPVAEFKSPFIGTEDTKKFLYILVKKHIPRAILCIERNHVGAAIIEGMKDMGLLANLYFDHTKQLVGNIDDGIDDSGFLKQQAFNRRLFGVYTEKASRDIMINILFRRVAEAKNKFICANIISDLLHLVKNKKGKIEAIAGQHDDSIMSYMIALYVLYYGNNLERYGFVRGHIPDEIDRNKGMSHEDSIYEVLDEEFHPSKFADTVQDDISKKLAEEVYKAKQELDLVDRISFNSGNFRTVDEAEEFESSIPMSFFDELNN